jgi:hypothetical protein
MTTHTGSDPFATSDDPFEVDPFAGGTPAPVSPAPEVVEESVTPPRGAPVGGSGRREVIRPAPPLPAWEDTDMQDAGDAADGEVDYSDLYALNRDLNKLRVRMARVRREMRRAGREALEAKLRYQRALRRALVQQTGGSAESRKASAELLCEELEADMAMRAQVADEFSTLFRSVRDDIENAKVVAYNLRALHNMQ